MANLCQPCGRRGVAVESFRTIWLNPESEFELYIEWDKDCPNGCGNIASITLTNSESGETRDFSPNEVWVLFGGGEDEVGLMS